MVTAFMSTGFLMNIRFNLPMLAFLLGTFLRFACGKIGNESWNIKVAQKTWKTRSQDGQQKYQTIEVMKPRWGSLLTWTSFVFQTTSYTSIFIEDVFCHNLLVRIIWVKSTTRGAHARLLLKFPLQKLSKNSCVKSMFIQIIFSALVGHMWLKYC